MKSFALIIGNSVLEIDISVNLYFAFGIIDFFFASIFGKPDFANHRLFHYLAADTSLCPKNLPLKKS